MAKPKPHTTVLAQPALAMQPNATLKRAQRLTLQWLQLRSTPQRMAQYTGQAIARGTSRTPLAVAPPSPQAITGALRVLVRLGLVQRCGQGGKLYSLTPQGYSTKANTL